MLASEGMFTLALEAPALAVSAVGLLNTIVASTVGDVRVGKTVEHSVQPVIVPVIVRVSVVAPIVNNSFKKSG